jgi:acyl phosphate:glycerol-3-phosphate acyltransferase
MRIRRGAFAVGIGYLVGTFPTADLVARRVSGGTIDLRLVGSGNPGGANALKMLGKQAGYTVMAVDVAKGAAASTLGRLLAGPIGAHAAGTASVVGHCWPAWSGGRGGKGVAAGVGQCLATFPAYFPVELGVAAATSIPRLKQRAFATTVISSVCWVTAALVWWRKRLPNLWGPRPTVALPLAAAISSGVIAYRFATASTPAGPTLTVVGRAA